MGARRKRGNLRTELYTSTGALPESWRRFLPEGHFLQPDALALYEQAQLEDIEPYYACLYEGGEPVMAAAFQLLRIRPKHFYKEDSGRFGKLLNAVARLVRPKLLVAGHLFRHDAPTFYARPGTAPYDVFRHYLELIEKTMQQSCANAVMVKDVSERSGVYFRQFAPQYLHLRNDISMALDIPAEWTGIDDYERALKHKYAQRFRKTRQAFQPVEVKALDADEVAAQADTIYRLYREVSDKQAARLGYISRDTLPLLKRRYPDRLHVWALTEEGQTVGFASAWALDGALDMFYIGFDYSRNARLQLYFNILFLSLEQAIKLGSRRLILGRTALEAKARLGCTPEYLPTFLYIRNPWLRRLTARLQERLQQSEGDWEQRHPFKK